jgi:predicted 3-demethylubiquinone-9 3-methyltransferase (glyoxalase superfamily)
LLRSLTAAPRSHCPNGRHSALRHPTAALSLAQKKCPFNVELTQLEPTWQCSQSPRLCQQHPENIMPIAHRISPCLWFDNQAEEAANSYITIFKNSKVTNVSRYGKAGQEVHGRPPGSVMVVAFELEGQPFTALNGGPVFKFNEAISLQVNCATQEEIDYYWTHLSQGGDPAAQQCGWLKDKYGVSWQIVPTIMPTLFAGPGSDKSERAMAAMLKMKKLDIAKLQQAYAG